jgi:hypothetical protein
MRIQPPPPAALGRQLVEWRMPLDTNPDVDAAVTRMLRAIDRHLQLRREPQEQQEEKV